MTAPRRESVNQSVYQSNKAASITKASQSGNGVRMPLMMKPLPLKEGVLSSLYEASMLFVLNRQP